MSTTIRKTKGCRFIVKLYLQGEDQPLIGEVDQGSQLVLDRIRRNAEKKFGKPVVSAYIIRPESSDGETVVSYYQRHA